MINPKAVENQHYYIINSIQNQIEAIAASLPHGNFFEAKNIQGSTFNKLVKSFGYELQRIEAVIKNIADEHYIFYTYSLLEEWESAVGIPDNCFKVLNRTIEERQKQVIAKLALMNIQTRQEFIDLAAFFGFNITIENGMEHGGFPMIFPIIFFDNAQDAHFTMIVRFIDLDKPTNIFTLTFPVLFSDGEENFLKCIIKKLAQANINVIFLYKNY